ncbi:CarD family transcriptional regulator [Cellulomonas xiejunii]|uniref:CarD family transcriptional regulator n=1 Tax=Cellulomonas xiejunii TaxID=2968083 RepID=A0ABY5KNW6_9CELL|nr:CarD family transcriptional regulator [Cellulomonas xiejunii]MCC2314927.1 CarD family transcriptional regulator [Cellulomonas xiejunii]MCC2322112.1 CarD family transcriptional regulator [Cellulomonas xiejunii]MCC2323245.1 CarD family transcriptional regulator [Cellulomonas xiejunii]UUI72169.1 CarD family transcriptional regulator [Cellulomonas xiejunii]
MQPAIGEIVVHPHHGPTRVVDLLERTFRGETHQYLQLEVVGSGMIVSVPLAKADEIGLRPLYDADGIAALLAVLSAPTAHVHEAWTRRFKENQERMRSQDHLVQAEVVRDLTRRSVERGLSTGEKDQLWSATQPLLTEMALALGVERERAQEMIDAAILDDKGSSPELHSVS